MLSKKKSLNIEESIASLMFEDAYLKAMEIGIDKCWDKWSNSLCYKKPVEMYSFLMYCIARDERAVFHFYIFQLLIFVRPFFDDPYVLAYWHMKRALTIEPDNTDIMRWILKTFEPYPERFMSNKEIVDLANQILTICPNDAKGLEIKAKYQQ